MLKLVPCAEARLLSPFFLGGLGRTRNKVAHMETRKEPESEKTNVAFVASRSYASTHFRLCFFSLIVQNWLWSTKKTKKQCECSAKNFLFNDEIISKNFLAKSECYPFKRVLALVRSKTKMLKRTCLAWEFKKINFKIVFFRIFYFWRYIINYWGN